MNRPQRFGPRLAPARVACLLAAAPLACVGAIDAEPESPEPLVGEAAPSPPPGPPPPRPGDVVRPPSGPASAGGAGPLPLRRLSRREYTNTVRDLLGVESRPGDQLPADRDESFPFRRVLLVTAHDAALLRSAAETLAAGAIKNLARLLPCDPAAAGEAACARSFVETFGLRAYRRPLAPDETERLMALYASGRGALKLGFADAIGLVIEAMLQAPAFLYHGEAAAGASIREGGAVRLGGYEIAARLSYFLWGTMPDRELFAAAAAGRLGTQAEVEAQAARLLASPRAKETVSAFFEDWFRLDAVAESAKDPKVYPQYTEALKTALVAEGRTFAASVLLEGDGRWETFLGSWRPSTASRG